jgi:hypothetical protein
MQLRSLFPAIAAAAVLAVNGTAAAQAGCRVPSGYSLLISAEPIEMAPGQTRVVQVAMARMPSAPRAPLPRACTVRWSVPPGSHASIDAGGRLRLTRYARVGDKLTVTADVAGQQIWQEVQVIDPHPNPIAGTWAQSGPAQCGGATDAATERVRELAIRRDGRFSATFVPFETYKDYWGTYTYDRASGALVMRTAGGNRVPPGLDLSGTARVVNGRLTLRGMWLGQPTRGTPRACTYVFAK